MDIWNVAFPEGAVIDPHTAWKVFWRTAASMYGEGGFRVENIFENGILHQVDVLGEYCSKLDYDGSHDSYLKAIDATIEGGPLQVLAEFENHPRSFFDQSRQLEFMPFVPMQTTSCRPAVVISAHRCMFCLPSSCDCDDKFSKYGFPSQREFLSENRNFSERLSSLSGLVYQKKSQIHRDRYRVSLNHCYLLFFNPEDLGYWGNDYLGLDWVEWWEKIEGGDMMAFNMANLAWCDWVITEMRSIFDFRHRPIIKFVYSKRSIVGPRAYYNTHEEYIQEIMYQLSLPLPLRRYEQ